MSKANWNVAVLEDGCGCFQARCAECDWRSRWFECGSKEQRNAYAIAAAKLHGQEHARESDAAKSDAASSGKNGAIQ